MVYEIFNWMFKIRQIRQILSKHVNCYVERYLCKLDSWFVQYERGVIHVTWSDSCDNICVSESMLIIVKDDARVCK